MTLSDLVRRGARDQKFQEDLDDYTRTICLEWHGKHVRKKHISPRAIHVPVPKGRAPASQSLFNPYEHPNGLT